MQSFKFADARFKPVQSQLFANKLRPATLQLLSLPTPTLCQACPAALQESLGGNTKTSLVIAVANAQDHLDETLQSLQFASRAMRVMTRAVVNERIETAQPLAPEIMAQLEQQADQANALEASLLRKEEQLEAMQGQLQVRSRDYPCILGFRIYTLSCKGLRLHRKHSSRRPLRGSIRWGGHEILCEEVATQNQTLEKGTGQLGHSGSGQAADLA